MTVPKIIAGAWIFIGVLWLLASFSSKTTVRTQSAGSRVVQTCLTLAAYLLLFGRSLRVGPLAWRILPDSPLVAYVGLALTLGGIAFAIWARLLLGTNWSSTVTLKENHQLVRSGPYAIVRHPIYSGLLLAILGTAIAWGEVRGLLALILAIIGWRLKFRVEESFMMGQFGSEYAQYKREVKALIPFVW